MSLLKPILSSGIYFVYGLSRMKQLYYLLAKVTEFYFPDIGKRAVNWVKNVLAS
jgi:hypothetical protein